MPYRRARSRRSIRPCRSFCFPDPNEHPQQFESSYRVDLYDDLLDVYHIMMYEMIFPNHRVPYTFVLYNFESHEILFHHILHTQLFDRHRYFFAQLWHAIYGPAPWRPAEFSLSIAEADEPVVFRNQAATLINRFYAFGHLQPIHDMFDEEVDDDSSDSTYSESGSPSPTLKFHVGR